MHTDCGQSSVQKDTYNHIHRQHVLQLWKLQTTGQIGPVTHDILVLQIAADCLVIHIHAWCFSSKRVSNRSAVNCLHMWKVQRHHSVFCVGRIKKTTKQ